MILLLVEYLDHLGHFVSAFSDFQVSIFLKCRDGYAQTVTLILHLVLCKRRNIPIFLSSIDSSIGHTDTLDFFGGGHGEITVERLRELDSDVVGEDSSTRLSFGMSLAIGISTDSESLLSDT